MKSKKYTALKISLIILMLASFAGAGGGKEYERFTDGTFGFSLYIPAGWKRSARDQDSRHVLTLRRGDRADITVTATTLDGEEKIKWEQWKTWCTRGIGSPLRTIVETGEFAVNDATAQIMVFEYTYHGRRVLQRTMAAKNGNRLVIVECRSPLLYFSGYTDVFNVVMSGLNFSGAGGRENEKVVDFREEMKKSDADRKSADEKNQKIKKKDRGKIKKEDVVEKENPDLEQNDEGEGSVDATALDDAKKENEEKIIIEEELKNIKELERKGIIEKIDDSEI